MSTRNRVVGFKGYQANLTLMVAANVIAFIFAGENIKYFVVSVISFALLLFAFEAIVTGITRHSRHSGFEKKYGLIKKEVFALSLEEAERIAEQCISNRERFITHAAGPDAMLKLRQFHIAELSLSYLFSKYDSVKATRGEFWVATQHISESSFLPAYTRIGVDHDSTELVVKAGDDTVYEIDGSESSGPETAFPSIFHLIVITDRVLYS